MEILGTPDDAADGLLDGRSLRRERNVDAVIDAVLEMFAEEALFPTIEQAAARSGLSLRSLYRYFADPGELMEAAISRSRVLGVEASHLAAIGHGPLEGRIDEFVAMRIRLHETVGPVYRATVANAARLPRIREELTRNRHDFREQFELQFAPELSALKTADRAIAVSAGDLLTQLDSIEFLRRHRQLSMAETSEVLRVALRALLG
jgi:AcrR family transcriptional regulator